MKLVNEDNPDHTFTLDDLDLLILREAIDEYIDRLGETPQYVIDRALGLREWLKENAP